MWTATALQSEVSGKWDLGLQVPGFSGFCRFSSVSVGFLGLKTEMQDY